MLQEALAARALLLEVEELGVRRRVAYQQAIRRLHSSGASMREIAEALELSHQRVHQIVNGGEAMTPPTQKKRLLRRLVGRNRTGCEATPGEPPPVDRFSSDAREALAFAQEEARDLNHDYLGTEHLLLGLIRAEHGLAARLLATVGADLALTRAAIERLMGKSLSGGTRRSRPETARLKKILELSLREAKSRQSTHVRSEHLLLALASEGEGLGARLLAQVGAVHGTLASRLDRATLACSFCARGGLEVDHLIAGPGVFICEHCVSEAVRVDLASDDEAVPKPVGGMRVLPPTAPNATCSFCGKTHPQVDRLTAAAAFSQPIGDPRPEVAPAICNQCVTICHEIRQAAQPG